MKFKFITTPKSLKKVIVYYRSMDDISNIIHSDKATECLNVNLKEMPAAVKNIPIELDLYLSGIDAYAFDSGDYKHFIASMYQQMLPCYNLLANCPTISVTETFDDFRMKYESKIKISHVIHPSGKDRKKWIDSCVDKAVTASKASVLGDAIDLDYDDDAITITVHMQTSPFMKDGNCALQIGTFIKELMLLLEKDLNKRTVICCSKCFKELFRANSPIKFTRRFQSNFHIVSDLCEIKCCEDAEWIDIDTELYPTIKYMNDHGVKTSFCCASHPDNDFDMYVAFSKKDMPTETIRLLLERMSQKYELLMTDVHKYFKFELDEYPYSENHAIQTKYAEYADYIKEVGFEKAREERIQLLHTFCVTFVEYYEKLKEEENNELHPVSVPEHSTDHI